MASPYINKNLDKNSDLFAKQHARKTNTPDLLSILKLEIGNSGNKVPTLKFLSQLLQISPATLKRKLKEYNLTYIELKNMIRFEKAQVLLSTSDKKLASISLELGFNDTSNFIKSFKLWSGTTPGRYRQLNQELKSKHSRC